MAGQAEQLWQSLDDIESKIADTIKDMDKLSKAALALNGDVARVLPIQLKAAQDSLSKIISNGADDQSTIENLKGYVDAIPLGDLREKSAEETIAVPQEPGPAPAEPAPAPVTPAVPAPDLTNGPKSEVVKESKNTKEERTMKFNENGELSFDAILDETGSKDLGFDEEAAMSIPSASDFASVYDYEEESEEEPSFDDYEASLDKDEGELPSYEDAMSFNKDNFAVTDGRYTDNIVADHANVFTPEDDTFDAESYEADQAAIASGNPTGPNWQDVFDFNEEV